MTVERTAREDRRRADSWPARPILAGALRAVVMLVPMGASLAVTLFVRAIVSEPTELVVRLAWWIVLLILAVGVAVAVERQARRLLPLVTLLKLGMLFPDQAPSRFAVAREAGSVRRLEARVQEIEDDPSAADESTNARTILALTVALQNHDRRTRGHSERVRVYADLLAEELKLPDEDRYRLRWAALLHDVGKLRVRARTLNKPAELDDREWKEMRGHPVEGARIAKPLLTWLGPWGWAIMEHHERIDGRGYPAGIPGDRISLAARIVSVADAYDSMTAARTYKKPMAVRAARQQLADCAGTQFDPEIVRAFFAISLPRLLWKTGPVSLLFHLPHLSQLEAIGRQSLVAATQTMTVATVASVTALSIGTPLSAAADTRVRGRAAISIEATSAPAAGPSVGAQENHAQADYGGETPGPPPERSIAPQPVPEPAPQSETTTDGSTQDDEAGEPEEPAGAEAQGQSDLPQGQSDQPHGQSDQPHGQSDQPHGQSDEPHGQSDDPHGQSDDPHGQSDDPPGQGDLPGQSEDPPGQSDDPPGQSEDPPGQSDDPPGQSEDPPGQGDPPGHG